MAASITVHLQIFKRPQLPHFSTDLDETGIKIHGILRSFISNIVIIRVAVPFKEKNFLTFWYFSFYEQLKFRAQLRSCITSVPDLGPYCL